jgi:hypothetical protein
MVERLHNLVVIAVELSTVDVFRHLVNPLRVPVGQVPLVGESDHTLERSKEEYYEEGSHKLDSKLKSK